MNKQKQKITHRERRHKRVRAKIKGTAEAPRISVFKSGRHIYVQAIDDISGKTIFSMNDFQTKEKSKINKALNVGRMFGEVLKKGGTLEAVFDRGGFKYHGRIKSLAEGLRESGIKI